MVKAKIVVTLKKGVSDPQGLAVQNALKTMQYSGVRDVRMGKYIEVLLDAAEREARTQVESMCEKLLVNPIIEQYSFSLEAIEKAQAHLQSGGQVGKT